MATKQYVDYTEEEYFDAEVSLDGEDIKLTPKNNRTLDFTGTILINGSEPQTGAEVQANWTEDDNTKADFIKNKPTLATVATSGSYGDLSNTPNAAIVEGTDSVSFKLDNGDLLVTFDGTTYYKVSLTVVEAGD